MERLRNGIYATAMDMHIMNAYEEILDDDTAESLMTMWLMIGVPDGNTLSDNINDFGENKDFTELLMDFKKLCRMCHISDGFEKEVEEIKKNIVEMLDNPYYDMV